MGAKVPEGESSVVPRSELARVLFKLSLQRANWPWSEKAAIRLSDFKLGTGDEIKADKTWHGIGLPQVAMHSQLPRFLVSL